MNHIPGPKPAAVIGCLVWLTACAAPEPRAPRGHPFATRIVGVLIDGAQLDDETIARVHDAAATTEVEPLQVRLELTPILASLPGEPTQTLVLWDKRRRNASEHFRRAFEAPEQGQRFHFDMYVLDGENPIFRVRTVGKGPYEFNEPVAQAFDRQGGQGSRWLPLGPDAGLLLMFEIYRM